MGKYGPEKLHIWTLVTQCTRQHLKIIKYKNYDSSKFVESTIRASQKIQELKFLEAVDSTVYAEEEI